MQFKKNDKIEETRRKEIHPSVKAKLVRHCFFLNNSFISFKREINLCKQN